MGKIKRRLKKQTERAERNRPPRSRLDYPVEGWTGDMPDNAEDCGFPPRLIWVNELNDVWMEIPRYVSFGWGGLWPLAFTPAISLLFCIFLLFMPGAIFDIPMVVVSLCGTFFFAGILNV